MAPLVFGVPSSPKKKKFSMLLLNSFVMLGMLWLFLHVRLSLHVMGCGHHTQDSAQNALIIWFMDFILSYIF